MTCCQAGGDTDAVAMVNIHGVMLSERALLKRRRTIALAAKKRPGAAGETILTVENDGRTTRKRG